MLPTVCIIHWRETAVVERLLCMGNWVVVLGRGFNQGRRRALMTLCAISPQNFHQHHHRLPSSLSLSPQLSIVATICRQAIRVFSNCLSISLSRLGSREKQPGEQSAKTVNYGSPQIVFLAKPGRRGEEDERERERGQRESNT